MSERKEIGGQRLQIKETPTGRVYFQWTKRRHGVAPLRSFFFFFLFFFFLFSFFFSSSYTWGRFRCFFCGSHRFSRGTNQCRELVRLSLSLSLIYEATDLETEPIGWRALEIRFFLFLTPKKTKQNKRRNDFDPRLKKECRNLSVAMQMSRLESILVPFFLLRQPIAKTTAIRCLICIGPPPPGAVVVLFGHLVLPVDSQVATPPPSPLAFGAFDLWRPTR